MKKLISVFVTLSFFACEPNEVENKNKPKFKDTLSYNPFDYATKEIQPPLINKGESFFNPTIFKHIQEDGKDLIEDENGFKREGIIYITYKDFYGSNPYKIPFVTTVCGYISHLYLNDKEIKFKEGEETFFRQSINLENGYNRIPIKVITRSGKEYSDYIEITIENMK